MTPPDFRLQAGESGCPRGVRHEWSAVAEPPPPPSRGRHPPAGPPEVGRRATSSGGPVERLMAGRSRRAGEAAPIAPGNETDRAAPGRSFAVPRWAGDAGRWSWIGIGVLILLVALMALLAATSVLVDLGPLRRAAGRHVPAGGRLAPQAPLPALARRTARRRRPRRPRGRHRADHHLQRGEPGARDPAAPRRGRRAAAEGTERDERARVDGRLTEGGPVRICSRTPRAGWPARLPARSAVSAPFCSASSSASTSSSGSSSRVVRSAPGRRGTWARSRSPWAMRSSPTARASSAATSGGAR